MSGCVEVIKPNSIMLSSSELAPNMFGAGSKLASSELTRASRFVAKFHYTSWFGAGSEHGSELAPNQLV